MTDISLSLEPEGFEETATSTDGVFELNLAHTQQGIDHLIELFKNGPRNQVAVAAVLDLVQELEQEIWNVYNAFDPDTAVGHALDLLGKIVGEARLSRTDEEYRAAIRARVLVNHSNGKLEELLDILTGMFGALAEMPTITVSEFYPAGIRVDVHGSFFDITVDTIHRLLSQAKAAGVKLRTVYANDDPFAKPLIWASSSVPDQDHGWSSSLTANGRWAQAR